jgi:hypothetical protein
MIVSNSSDRRINDNPFFYIIGDLIYNSVIHIK